MSSQLAEAARNSTMSLPLMPSELLTKIFCQLPSFSAVFALSATCHRLRHIWFSNVSHIYGHVAPKIIACDKQARNFLIEQDGPTLDCTLSTKDVIEIIRNSSLVEKAIQQFEREIVSRVRIDGYSASQYYGAGARRHPFTLTRTERRRFIRSYYGLWGMLQSKNSSKWSSKLESLTLKQLYRLHEMTKLTQSIGQGEERVPPPVYPDEPPDSVHSINSGQSEERLALSDQIWQHIQQISQRVFHQDAPAPSVFAKHEGFMGFVVLWDHWQESFKDLVCHESTVSPALKPSPTFEKQYIWDDSSDEDQQE